MSSAIKLSLNLIILVIGAPAAGQSFEASAAKARKASRLGQQELAVEYWSDALRVWSASDGKPKRAKALAARAALYEKSGQTTKALKDLDAAVQLYPKSASAFDSRGQLLLHRGAISKAISDFYSATKLDINFGPAYLHRAQAYERQGDQRFAREDYRVACKLGVKAGCHTPPKKPATKPAPRLDFQSCLDAIDQCSEQLNALSVCVKRVEVCEKTRVKGCCPQACVRQFLRSASPDKSDAEVFRSVFSIRSPCVRVVVDRR